MPLACIEISAHHPEVHFFFVQIVQQQIPQRDEADESFAFTYGKVAEAMLLHGDHAALDRVVGPTMNGSEVITSRRSVASGLRLAATTRIRMSRSENTPGQSLPIHYWNGADIALCHVERRSHD